MNTSYMSKSLVKLSHAWIQEFCQEVGESMHSANVLFYVLNLFYRRSPVAYFKGNELYRGRPMAYYYINI